MLQRFRTSIVALAILGASIGTIAYSSTAASAYTPPCQALDSQGRHALGYATWSSYYSGPHIVTCIYQGYFYNTNMHKNLWYVRDFAGHSGGSVSVLDEATNRQLGEQNISDNGNTNSKPLNGKYVHWRIVVGCDVNKLC